MNQEQFIAKHEQQWLILEVLLNPTIKSRLLKGEVLTKEGKTKKISPYEDKIKALDHQLITQADFTALYKDICQHLSLAQSRRYSPYLLERLSFLVDSAHQKFYQPMHTHSEKPFRAVVNFFMHTFPQTVRREIKWLYLSSAFFFLPLVIMIALIQVQPEFVYSILSPDTVFEMEAMYDPSAGHIGRERGSDSDSKMFGFYIFNNTGIGFRTFATGFFFGIGSLFTLLFNGFYIGAIAGHLTQIGYGHTFWPFVSGHSAMELTAIALSGAAGLKLGFSLLIPRRKSRYQSLLDAAHIAVKIMSGAALMFFIAAFIEAFWSSSQTVPIGIKYLVGIAMWLVLIVFFSFSGQKQKTASIGNEQ